MDNFRASSSNPAKLNFEFDADSYTKKILVVDDNATTLRGIKKVLDPYYEVTLANSGMRAIAAITKEKPDLILLDYEMPVCDGKQTFEMIKADEDMKDIPVLFLTGVNERAHITAVLMLKPAGYMLKPYEPEKLLAAIKKILYPEQEQES